MALRSESLSQNALKSLSEIYVQRLLRNANYSPEGMEELTRRREWQKANQWQREEVVVSIKQMTRETLVAAGYNIEMVCKILPNTNNTGAYSHEQAGTYQQGARHFR